MFAGHHKIFPIVGKLFPNSRKNQMFSYNIDIFFLLLDKSFSQGMAYNHMLGRQLREASVSRHAALSVLRGFGEYHYDTHEGSLSFKRNYTFLVLC